MNTAPKILVVIPCLNEEHTLDRLVRQLVRGASATTHIVIADGGSTDKTISIAQRLAAEFTSVTLIDNPKRLQSAAINHAVESCGQDADILIRIDAHAAYPDDYCQRLIEEAQKIKADSIVVTMDTVGSNGFQKAVAAAQNSKLGNGGSAHRNQAVEGQWVDHGHHALMRISAFRAVGGYDATFSHNEDAELDIRLTRAGYKIWLTAKTRLTYYPRASAMRLFKQYYYYGRGRVRTTLKHKVHLKLRQMLPVFVFPAAILALLAPICSLFVLPILGWAALCLLYGFWLGKITKDNTIMLAGIAAMLMHLSWSIGFWHGLYLYRHNT